MNRRQFLVAAAAIPALARAIVAAPAAEPEYVTGILRRGMQEFEIIYPDGTVWSFAGMITAESETEFSVKPSGGMTMTHRDMREFTPDEPKAAPASSTMITRNGGPAVELQDITLPSLTRAIDQDGDQSYVGLRRTGEITFCGKFL